MREHSDVRTTEKPEPQFDRLVGAHRCDRGSAATIVLAAVAARNGLTFSGAAMPEAGGAGRPAALLWIARETGLSIDTVRTASKALLSSGEVTADPAGGLRAVAAALVERWNDARRRISLDRRSRTAGLSPNAMLLVGLVAWSTPATESGSEGALRLGVGFLAERIGCSTRAVDRALAVARDAQLITTWTHPIPGGGYRKQLSLAHRKSSPGKSPTGAAEPIGFRRPAPSEPVARPHRESTPGPIGNRRHGPSVFVGRLPEVQPDAEPESPPERLQQAPASPAGEPVAALPMHEPAPASPASLGEKRPGGDEVQKSVEAWLLPFRTRGIERMRPQDAAAVVMLLELVGSAEQVLNPRAVARERLGLAARVIAWCPWPERLCRWLVRARRRFGVANLGAYLRRACQRGDPGTLLGSSPAATSIARDFSPSTERALEGEHGVKVAQLVEVGATIRADRHDDQRAKLRAELRRYLGENRPSAARTVLLQLIGSSRDDMAIMRAIGDVCAVSDARALLQGVA